MIEPRWLSVDEVLHLHALQISEFGGTPGLRDINLLEAAVMRPRQRFHYGELKSIVELAVAYAIALSTNHPFIDGNKRVAFHSLLVFLRFHGLILDALANEAAHMMIGLAAGTVAESQLVEWVRAHVRRS